MTNLELIQRQSIAPVRQAQARVQHAMLRLGDAAARHMLAAFEHERGLLHNIAARIRRERAAIAEAARLVEDDTA